MEYIKTTNKIWALIGLETFVFATFIGICALINWLIVGIPNIPDKPAINFFYALLKVGISLLFIGIWLFVWYYLTKKLMGTNIDKDRENK